MCPLDCSVHNQSCGVSIRPLCIHNQSCGVTTICIHTRLQVRRAKPETFEEGDAEEVTEQLAEAIVSLDELLEQTHDFAIGLAVLTALLSVSVCVPDGTAAVLTALLSVLLSVLLSALLTILLSALLSALPAALLSALLTILLSALLTALLTVSVCTADYLPNMTLTALLQETLSGTPCS